NDLNEIRQALTKAKENTNQPTLIEVKTVIGYGSPNKSASSSSHGAPLGEEEVKLTKEFYKWPHDAFHVPEEVYEDFHSKVVENGTKKEWNDLFKRYQEKHPDLAAELERAIKGELPSGWDHDLPV